MNRQHKDLAELIKHLGDRMDETRMVCPDWEDWSDGDKLRAFAYNQLSGAHIASHAGVPIDLTGAREMLRMAARLDILDVLEAREDR